MQEKSQQQDDVVFRSGFAFSDVITAALIMPLFSVIFFPVFVSFLKLPKLLWAPSYAGVLVLWAYFNRDRFWHRLPYFKLTAAGLIDSRLGEDYVLAWARMREPKVREYCDGYDGPKKEYFVFLLDPPFPDKPETPEQLDRLRTYVRKAAEKARRCKNPMYPMRVHLPLDGFWRSGRVAAMLKTRIKQARRQ